MIIVRLFRSLVLCLSTFNPLRVIKSITMHVWCTKESRDRDGRHTHMVSASSLEAPENASLAPAPACTALKFPTTGHR